MRERAIALLLTLGFLAIPSLSNAQTLGTIAGNVKDASGAVLPGVTVEAASPALIQKVRTAVTDGSGRYRIESLPPGRYTGTLPPPRARPLSPRVAPARQLHGHLLLDRVRPGEAGGPHGQRFWRHHGRRGAHGR